MKYTIASMPPLDRPSALAVLLCVQDIRRNAAAIIISANHQKPHGARASPVLVAFSILDRLCEASISAELLLAHGRARDGAVITLSMLELQLTLQYISRDAGRVDEWRNHTQAKRCPWTIADMLRDTSQDPEDLDCWRSVYQTLSMTKHGNPHGNVMSYELAVGPDVVTFHDSKKGGTLCGPVANGVGTCLVLAQKAAIRMLRGEAFDVEAQSERLIELEEALTRAVEKDLIEMLGLKDG